MSDLPTAAPLLTSKLRIPRQRADWISRPRLIQRLDQAFERPLTLLSAPAGSGKTTLLSEWISERMKGTFGVPDVIGGSMRNDLGRESLHPSSLILHPSKFAWLSLEESDSDPVRFFTYFIAALQTVQPGIGAGLQAMLASPQAAQLASPQGMSGYLYASLLNEIDTIPHDFVLILDDYHLISAPPVHAGLVFLLDHQPAAMHLVIATRSDPPLPLARYRGRGQLIELRAGDLRFTVEEAGQLLSQLKGLEVSSEDLSALTERTEGWAAGLSLAAIAMASQDERRTTKDEGNLPSSYVVRPSSFVHRLTSTNQFILDYLVEEVLNRQPEPIQDFLMRTSILERMCGELCDAVLENRESRIESGNRASPDSLFSTLDSQAALEYLEHANLFILPLDNERRWYRYHHLFAELLRHRLNRFQRALVPELHRRAAVWFEGQGSHEEAVDHWVQAGDFENAARMMEAKAFQLLEVGQLSLVLGWLRRIPEEIATHRPWLCVYHAWALLLTGQVEAAEAAFPPASQIQAADRQPLLGHIDAIGAYTAALRSDLQTAGQLASRALQRLPEGDLSVRSIVAFTLGGVKLLSGDFLGALQAFGQAAQMGQASGNIHLAVPALGALADLQAAQGQLHKSEETYRKALELSRVPQGQAGQVLPIAAGALTGLGELQYEWNDLDAANRYLHQGYTLSGQWGNVDSLASSLVSLARCQQAMGQAEKARQRLEEAIHIARDHTLTHPVRSSIYAAIIQWHLQNQDSPAARRLAEEYGLNPAAEIQPGREMEFLALARLLLREDRPQEAEIPLARLRKAAESTGQQGRLIPVLNLQALALQARGETRQALEVLRQAIALSEPEGYIRTFIDEGQALFELLRQAYSQGSIPSHPRKLLAAFQTQLNDAEPALREAKGPTLKDETSVLRPFASLRASSSSFVESLSERELEVLRLIAEGLSNQAIALRLVISLGTVKAHTYSIYQKLQVSSRTQAVARARELNWL